MSSNDLIEPSVEMIQDQRAKTEYEKEADEIDEPSAKIDLLLKLLTLLPRSEKSLVFSSFTSYLDMVAARLKTAGYE